MAGIVPFFPRSILAIDWLLTLACVAGIRLSQRIVAEGWRPGPRDGRPGVAPRPDRRRRRRRRARRARDRRRTRSSACTRSASSTIDPTKLGKRIYGVPVARAARRPRGRGGALRRRRGDHRDADRARRASSARCSKRARAPAYRHGRCPACSSCSTAASASTGCARSTSPTCCAAPRSARSPMPGCTCRAGSCWSPAPAGRSARSSAARSRTRGRRGSSWSATARTASSTSPTGCARRIRRCRSAPVIADIRDADRLRAIFAAEHPAIVFHAAAHKHVPLMEEHPEEAITNNVVGTRHVVDVRARRRRRALRADLDRQGGGADQHHGRDQAVAEVIVRRAAAQHGRGLPRGALRQRARQPRQRGAVLQAADRARRADHGHASRR